MVTTFTFDFHRISNDEEYHFDTVKRVYKNLEFKAGEGSCSEEHLTLKWYMTENFSLKVLNIAVLIYGIYFIHSSAATLRPLVIS